MRVLITGSRDFNDRELMEPYIAALPPGSVVVHGAARGADRLARDLALEHGLAHDPHPADWSRFRLAAGPLRNQLMVNAGADICYAFPLRGSKGTWDCAQRADEAGIPTFIITREYTTRFKEEPNV